MIEQIREILLEGVDSHGLGCLVKVEDMGTVIKKVFALFEPAEGELVENPHILTIPPQEDDIAEVIENTLHYGFDEGSKAQLAQDKARMVKLPSKAEAVKHFCSQPGCAWKVDDCSGDTCEHMEAVYDVFKWLKGEKP